MIPQSIKTFPVLKGAEELGRIMPMSIPWEFAETFRTQAEKNHNQTLEQLASRGGLSIQEIYRAKIGYDSYCGVPVEYAYGWIEEQLLDFGRAAEVNEVNEGPRLLFDDTGVYRVVLVGDGRIVLEYADVDAAGARRWIYVNSWDRGNRHAQNDHADIAMDVLLRNYDMVRDNQ